jgi:hypothetical protein
VPQLIHGDFQEREKALLKQGVGALDAERKSTKEAEAILAKAFPDWRWTYRVVHF